MFNIARQQCSMSKAAPVQDGCTTLTLRPKVWTDCAVFSCNSHAVDQHQWCARRALHCTAVHMCDDRAPPTSSSKLRLVASLPLPYFCLWLGCWINSSASAAVLGRPVRSQSNTIRALSNGSCCVLGIVGSKLRLSPSISLPNSLAPTRM